jgi:hypothetical protein
VNIHDDRRVITLEDWALIRRLAMTVIYMDADIRVAEPTNDQQARDRAWMPGAEVGQIPRTPLNPVLYDSRTA